MNANRTPAQIIRAEIDANRTSLARYLREHAESLSLEEIENIQRNHADTEAYNYRAWNMALIIGAN